LIPHFLTKIGGEGKGSPFSLEIGRKRGRAPLIPPFSPKMVGEGKRKRDPPWSPRFFETGGEEEEGKGIDDA
jgi:hypothetical protein